MSCVWLSIGLLSYDTKELLELKGTINLIQTDEGYDEKTDFSIFRLMFLCKHVY
ncbi:MAG TPA: hypothetical protein PKC14_04630 [Candidatus Absconditabacterales bacterium]|nr:hypothetical protein [Candidatus Absconditabacterales bacterium]